MPTKFLKKSEQQGRTSGNFRPNLVKFGVEKGSFQFVTTVLHTWAFLGTSALLDVASVGLVCLLHRRNSFRYPYKHLFPYKHGL